MERFLIALFAGLVGGAGGAVAVRFLVPPEAERSRPSGDTAAAVRDLKDAVASLERRMAAGQEVPGLAATRSEGTRGAGGGEAPSTLAADGAPAGTPPAPGRLPATREELKALVAEATKAALDERAAKEAEELKKKTEKKRVTLAEAARDLSLTAGEESEIRLAYQEANDKMLKLMAEPEESAEDLRRELTEAKGDKAKQTGLLMKHLPKIFAKIGDFMAIDGMKKARIQRAVGEEKAKALDAYKSTDEDPFDMEEGLTLTTGN